MYTYVDVIGNDNASVSSVPDVVPSSEIDTSKQN